MKKYFLAIDIGASSGRHIIGYYDESNLLVMDEVYRFPNSVDVINGHLFWDVDRLLKEVKTGIKKALEKYNHIESLSIDTWGVDYVLMNGDKEIKPVYAYRDQRTKTIIHDVHKIISFEDLYKITGSQFQEFNTIYQLYEDKISGRLNNVTDFLMIPEYLIYKITGKKFKEYTNASTTGMCDLKNKAFSSKITADLGLNFVLDSKLYKPGTVVGYLKEDVQKEVGGNIKVVLCSTHDTASAVEGIEMKENAPYISSGTWSLLGIKHKNGINNLAAFNANYSNEYGPNYVRVQKNIMGLWIIQNLSKQMNKDFPTMVEMAKKSSFAEIFDVNDNVFLSSLNMKEEIINWFLRNKKPVPKNDEDLINCTYHSLAYSYKLALEELESITGEKYNSLYIVGGGAKNKYLNELTQKYTNKKVVALPIEATALGNLYSQMEVANEKRSNQ